jgi:hypothetical protein
MKRLVTVSIPPVTGSPGLVQGSYGDAGNLELAVPAIDDGIWIFWFNADPVEHEAGAAMGCWSGGLHVFGGRAVDAARISQVQAGPNFLELLALSARTLHRLYWTPERGFVDAGPIATDVADVSPVRETGTELLVDVVDVHGARYLLAGDKLRYPNVAWTAREAVASVDAPPALPDVRADALAWCRTSIGGGRVDAVLRVGTALLHVHTLNGSWSVPEPIVSRVWLDGDGPVHRR